MVRYENECVGCPEGVPCFGSSCPLVNVPVYYCDRCGRDTDYDDIREMKGEDICVDCFFKIAGEDHPNPYELFRRLNFVES